MCGNFSNQQNQSPSKTISEKLKELKDLYEQELIDEATYNEKRDAIIASL